MMLMIKKQGPAGNGTAAAASKQQINLAWTSVTGATRYIVERATDAGFSDAEYIYTGADLAFASTGLTQNTTYYYRFSWSNNDVTKTQFDTESATTLNAGVTYDIDAEAIIAAIEFTVTLTTDAKVAIDDYVTALKTAAIWTKIKTIHVGKFADWYANSANWKNPDFNIESFPELYSGAVTHANGKISFAGAGAATEVGATRAFSTNWLIPSEYLSQDNKGYTFNITDAPTVGSSSDDFRFGSSTGSPNTTDRLVIRGKPNGVSQNDEAGISGVNVTGSNFMDTNLPGLYVYQRSGSAAGNVLLRKAGADLLTTLNASSGNVALPIATGGNYTTSPTPNSLHYRTYGRDFFAIHESFDGTEMAAWESAVNALLTALNLETYTPTTPPATTGRFIRFFGDSFTQWPAANATSGERGWWNQLGQRFNILPITSGQGGIGYYTQVNTCYTALETPSLDRMAVLIGYNDVKTFGTDANGYEHAKSGIRAMLVNQFLAAAVPASNGAVTKTGTWANPSPAVTNGKANKLGGTSQQSSTSGDKIEYTFTGDNVVIGVRNSNGSTLNYGAVDITVDAISQGSYDANNKAYNVTSSGGAIWNAIILKGFGGGSHTVELTLNEASPFIVDYFGTMQAVGSCFPVIIGDIQHDNTGTANRNANADLLTAEIKTMIAADFPEYSSIISFAATNSFYSLSNVDVDNVHPLDAGHKQIYRAFERVWIP